MTRPAPLEAPTDLPDGYHLTELGPLPEEWRVVRLGEVARQRKGFITVDETLVYKRPTIKLYGQGMVLRDNVIGATLKIKKQQVCKAYDFVVAEIDAKCGGFAVVPPFLEGAILSSHYFIFELDKEKVDPNFMSYIVKLPLLQRQVEARGSTNYASVRPSQVITYLIPLPPLAEQRAIAHVLRAVQRAKEASERVIAALRELKKSLMRHLFTYGPVPVGATHASPQRETQLGPLPAHWQVVRLGEVCRFQGGSQPPKSVFIYEPKEGYVRLLQIRDYESDDNATYVPKNSKLRLVSPEDVLIARYGASVGKILRGKCGAINVAIVKVINNPKKIHNDFLYYRLQQQDFQVFVKGLGGRAAQAGFNKGELNAFSLPLPPLSEQHEIARILQTVDRRIEAEEASVRALEALFKTLLHELMTAKRRLPQEFIARFQQEEIRVSV